jgi:hypothetical protein
MIDEIWQLAKPFAFLWLPSVELMPGNKDRGRIHSWHNKSFPFNNKDHEPRFGAGLPTSSDLSISSGLRRIDSCLTGAYLHGESCLAPTRGGGNQRGGSENGSIFSAERYHRRNFRNASPRWLYSAFCCADTWAKVR